MTTWQFWLLMAGIVNADPRRNPKWIVGFLMFISFYCYVMLMPVTHD